MKGVNERIAAKKSDHSMDDEVRIIQQDNTINPVIVEGKVPGKRVFGFDIGDVLRIEYICDEPPLGCAWSSIVGQRQTLSLAQWNEQYKARKM